MESIKIKGIEYIAIEKVGKKRKEFNIEFIDHLIQLRHNDKLFFEVNNGEFIDNLIEKTKIKAIDYLTYNHSIVIEDYEGTASCIFLLEKSKASKFWTDYVKSNFVNDLTDEICYQFDLNEGARNCINGILKNKIFDGHKIVSTFQKLKTKVNDDKVYYQIISLL